MRFILLLYSKTSDRSEVEDITDDREESGVADYNLWHDRLRAVIGDVPNNKMSGKEMPKEIQLEN